MAIEQEKADWDIAKQEWLVLISPKFLLWIVRTLPARIKEIWWLTYHNSW